MNIQELVASLVVEKHRIPGFAELRSDLEDNLAEKGITISPENLDTCVTCVTNGVAFFSLCGYAEWWTSLDPKVVDIRHKSSSPINMVTWRFQLETPKHQPITDHVRQVCGFSDPQIPGFDHETACNVINLGWQITIETLQFLSKQAA